jgi:hypothetical protein
MPDAFHMTQAQYAKHRNCTQGRIAQLIRQGKLDGSFKKLGRRYYINPDAADKLLEENRNPKHDARLRRKKEAVAQQKLKGISPSRGNGKSLNEAARLQMWYKAALLKLQFEEKSGALVSKERVDKQAARFATLVRTHLEALPSKLAPELASMRSTKKIAETIRHEVRAVLTTLGHEIKKL